MLGGGGRRGSGSVASTNSFETIAVPAGTNVVADSSTDTLTLSSSDNYLTITGTAGTDTIDFTKGSGFNEFVDDRVNALLVEGAGIDLTYDDGANTLTIASTITQYTDELAQDAVGGILVDSSTIDFTYNDGTPSITASVIAAGVDHGGLGGLGDDDHTIYVLAEGNGTVTDNAIVRWDGTTGRAIQDSGASIDDSGNLTANNFSGSSSGTNTGDQNVFSTIACSSGTNPAADTTSDTLTLTAGSGITVTGNSLTDTITIASTITQYTDELAQDAIGGILVDSSSIDFTYNDATPSITAVVLPAGVDHGGLGGLADDDHPAYTLDPGAVVDKEITIWSGTGGRSFSTSSGVAIGAATSKQIRPSGTDENLLLDGNGTGLVQLNTGSDSQQFPKTRPSGVTNPILTINESTGLMSWTAGTAAVPVTLQQAYTNDSNDGSVNIVLTSTDGGIFIKDAATPIAATLFSVSDNGGTSEYLRVDSAGITTDMDVVGDRFGVGGTAVSTLNYINAVVSSAVARQILNFDLTYTGSATSAGTAVLGFTDRGTASSYTLIGIQNSCILDTADHTTYTQQGLRLLHGTGASHAFSSGTYRFRGIDIDMTVNGTGGTHTGGTVTNIGIVQRTIGTYTGATNVVAGAVFMDDVCLLSGTKLVLENAYASNALTKGDSYLAYDASDVEIDVFVSNTLAFSFGAALNQSEVVLSTKAGSSTSYAKVGGVLNSSTTNVGNVGAGEDDLMTFSVPASTLATNGDRIDFRMAGTFAANVNSKRVRIKFGATTLLDTTGLAFNGADWVVRGTIIRSGASTQKAYCIFESNSALLSATADYTTPGETLSGAVTLKATGEATSNNDIVQELFTVDWLPNE